MKTIRETADLFDDLGGRSEIYEEIGLLSPARSEGNQRLYPASELVKLKLIVRGKKYGFSLEEIKEMVLLFDKDRTGRKQLERTIQYGRRRIEEVH